MGRRALSIGLSGVLVVGVGAVLLLAGREGTSQPDAERLTVVRGLIGSEKAAFFDDPEVRAAFAEYGVIVEVESPGTHHAEAALRFFMTSVPRAFSTGPLCVLCGGERAIWAL